VQSIFFSAIKLPEIYFGKCMIERLSRTSGNFTYVPTTVMTRANPVAALMVPKKIVEELRQVSKERKLKGKVRGVRSGCADVSRSAPT
jgi:hypothetical protein